MRCSKTGCKKHGVWQPVVEMRAFKRETPNTIEVPIQLCDRHRKEADIEDLVPLKFRKRAALELVLGGCPPINHALTRLRWRAQLH